MKGMIVWKVSGLDVSALILLLITIVNSVQIINITENHIPDNLSNVYDIYGITKGNNGINLRDVELICDHTTTSAGNNIEINRRSGDIVLKTIFDREVICPSRMTDDCSLNYVMSYNSNVKEFKLVIKDVNDNYPVFKDKIKEINIREGETDKSEYLLPRAVDSDTAVFGIDKYTVKFYDDDKSGDFFNEYFKLINLRNSDYLVTPVLKIAKLLDREKVDKFTFTLISWDKDQKSGDCKIVVNVIDINDNSPIWNVDAYSAEIKECAQSKEVMKLEAHDRDDSNTENGRITYEIGEKTKSNNLIAPLFHISGNVLYIDLMKLEVIHGYEFEVEVIAKDGGGRSSSKNVKVKLLDCNKNKPQIEISQRNPKISENEKKAMRLTNVVVTDLDRSLNSEFDCVIDDSNRFSLKTLINKNLENGKWVLYALFTNEGVEFDREKVSAIAILITCTDKGTPAQSSTQVVTVHVSDVNDNVPEFTRTIYTFSVEENSQIGVVVGTVIAIDNDSNENGRVTYQIESTFRGMFSVNNKGQIQTNYEIDREKVSSYEFRVVAKDHGSISLNGSCLVKVLVLDVNDCSPEVDKQFMFEILESRGFSQIHVQLGRIEAKDADLGLNGTLNFKISTFNNKDIGKKLLQITSDGLLSIYGNVDREVIKTIHSEIIVFDNGKPSLSTITTVSINILDVNDNKPKFVFPNYPNHNFINISLQSPIGNVLAVIEATDPDNGNNGSVSYKLMGGEHIKSFFDLHQSGQLILVKSLMDKRLNPDRLLIQALDGGDPPQSEITTLYLRYFNNQINVPKNSIEKKSDRSVKNEKEKLKDSTNVTLLYGLAAVLFVIFFASLIALFFIYANGRSNLAQAFVGDKNVRNRKNYSQKFQTSTNDHKGNGELLDPSLCEMPGENSKDNYTNLMFIKDPNYNLLFPRMLSKSDVEARTERSNTLNYFRHQSQQDPSMGPNSMRMLVNNLSPQIKKAQSMLHQSNHVLTYKGSMESLDDSNYNASCQINRDNTIGSKEDTVKIMPLCSSGYTQSYITSTFV